MIDFESPPIPIPVRILLDLPGQGLHAQELATGSIPVCVQWSPSTGEVRLWVDKTISHEDLSPFFFNLARTQRRIEKEFAEMTYGRYRVPATMPEDDE